MDGIARGSRVTTMTYNAAGSVDSVTDAATRTVSFEYDDAGRVIEQELPDLRVIGLEYDANGNLTSLTPPGRPAHGFTYLPRGQLQYYWPPQPLPLPQLAEPRTRYHYYLDGRLSGITRPDGEQIHLTYDPETGQLLVQTTPAGPVLYSYDTATGNPSTIGVSGETLTYAYDGSLPLGETWSGTVAGSVSRAYDTSFRVIEQRVNGGSTVGFDYDDDDLLTDAGAMTLTRDPATGLLTGTALGNTTDSHGYNSFGEVMSYAATVNGAAVYSASYTRDALGRIAAKTETVEGVADVYNYVYDAAGRLTDVVQNSTAIGHYEYDLNGNRVPDADGDQNLTFNQAGTLLGATYDAQDRLLGLEQGPAAVAYTYTDNGELQTRTVGTDVTGYGYDVFGNLVFGNLRSVTFSSADVIEYVVDGQNRRVGKKVNGVLSRGWVYDGQLRIVAELDGSNQVVSRFVYASKVNVPDCMVSGGATYRLISDHLGSVRLVIDASSGTVAQRLDYDEFGNVLLDTNPGFQPFGFAGGLYDPDTGLVRFGARDYDAVTGRWTAKDPIGFGGGLTNLFGYVSNDTVNRVDPAGLAAGLVDLSAGMTISSQLAARVVLNLPKLLSAANRARVSLALAGATVDRATSGLTQLLRPGGLQAAVQAFQQLGGNAAQWGTGNPAYGPVLVFRDQFLKAVLRYSSFGATPGVPMSGAPTIEITINGVAQVIKVRFLE